MLFIFRNIKKESFSVGCVPPACWRIPSCSMYRKGGGGWVLPPPPVNRHTPVKTLPFRKFVCGRLLHHLPSGWNAFGNPNSLKLTRSAYFPLLIFYICRPQKKFAGKLCFHRFVSVHRERGRDHTLPPGTIPHPPWDYSPWYRSSPSGTYPPLDDIRLGPPPPRDHTPQLLTPSSARHT